MTTVTYGRASATNPGKHGPRDWRVDYQGHPPTIGELLFMVGMYLVAEDRYDQPGHLGRHLLWHFVDQLLLARTPDHVKAICEDAQATVANPKTIVRGKGPPLASAGRPADTVRT